MMRLLHKILDQTAKFLKGQKVKNSRKEKDQNLNSHQLANAEK